jgi:2-oxoglutarate ferredoxin oxidoreductase subunit beta
MNRKGFSFIEVIAPCTTLYARRNRLGDGLNALEYYQGDAEIRHGADTRTVDIDFQGKIVIGKFVDREKPTYLEAVNTRYAKVIGDDYQLYGKTQPEREAEAKQEAEARRLEEARMLAEDTAMDEQEGI